MKFLRKTIMGVSAIAFTAITLTSTTYAWFKIYNTATVGGLNFSVNGGFGFMVSVDNINYKNDLTKEDIYGAMLVKNAPNRFGWGLDSNGETKLYTKTRKDIDGVATYVNDQIASETEISRALNEIQLMPLTSKDGVRITDLYDSDASAESGRFIEFDVYFKTISSKGQYEIASSYVEGTNYYQVISETYEKTTDMDTITDLNVNQYWYLPKGDTSENYQTNATKYEPEVYDYYKMYQTVKDVTATAKALFNDPTNKLYTLKSGTSYQIYLNGNTEDVPAQYESGEKIHEAQTISPTRFTSSLQKVDLSAEMKAVINGNKTTIESGDSVDVYAANALRMSIVDDNMFKESGGAAGSVIYEINDSVNGDKNLGSYATNLSDLTPTEGYTEELDLLYGYKFNASYSYYSNLKNDNS